MSFSALPVFLLALSALGGTPVAYAQASGNAAAIAVNPAAGSVPWASLNAEQKNALRPLAGPWPTLRPEQQRKWVALTHNFDRLSAAEQSTLQGRMAEWAALTPAQRTQARLNFGEIRSVPADEKRAKWEEYLALPAEERERLAADQPKPPVSAAPALRPTSPNQIVRPPTPPVAQPRTDVATPPNLVRSVVPVNRNTLLPQPPSSAPAAPAR